MERAIAAGASGVKKQPSLLSSRSEQNISYFVIVMNSCVKKSWKIQLNQYLSYFKATFKKNDICKKKSCRKH
jgi:hypothetical protein